MGPVRQPAGRIGEAGGHHALTVAQPRQFESLTRGLLLFGPSDHLSDEGCLGDFSLFLDAVRRTISLKPAPTTQLSFEAESRQSAESAKGRPGLHFMVHGPDSVSGAL